MKYNTINIYRPHNTLFFNGKAYLNKSNIEEERQEKKVVNKYLYPHFFLSDSDKITILKPLVSFIPKFFYLFSNTISKSTKNEKAKQ